MKKHKTHCCYCGESIIKKEIDGKFRDYCGCCNTVFYENPLPVASSIVVNENREVLLVKRKKDPYKEMWCLPIGFAESGEEVSEAALRELEEEAGVKGEIVRLIDVDTVNNYFYGSLAIVTYEVIIKSGIVSPGDDASEARYFPIFDIPQLAWSSNEKAIKLYLAMYSEIWSVMDSYKQLFPEVNNINDLSNEPGENRKFLSNVLIKLIDKHMNKISDNWIDEIYHKLPHIKAPIDVLVTLNKSILKGIQYWLKRQTDTLGVEEFIDTGQQLKALNISLPDIMILLALSRKSLWLFMMKEKILSSLIEIYTSLEMNNRIIFYYDKIIYYITLGYTGNENSD